MKIKISKIQWQEIGKKSGWIKSAGYPESSVEYWEGQKSENNPSSNEEIPPEKIKEYTWRYPGQQTKFLQFWMAEKEIEKYTYPVPSVASGAWNPIHWLDWAKNRGKLKTQI